MLLNSIYINNFRSLNDYALELNEKMNEIKGANGSGKTSILEAIFFAINLTSFRSSKKATIQTNAQYVKITIVLNNDYKIDILYNQQLTRVFINNEPIEDYTRLRMFNKMIFFNPFDFNIIVGNMSAKRKMLNFNISQLDDKYIALLKAAKEMNKTKNTSLKNNVSYETLKKINEDIFNVYQKIYEYRNDYITKISNLMHRNDTIKLIYRSPNVNFENITKVEFKFKKNKFNLDTDKLFIRENDEEVKNFASRGELKKLVFEIFWAQAKLLEETYNEKIVVLIDDLHAELDEKNISYIFSLFEEYQVLFTQIANNEKVELKNG